MVSQWPQSCAVHLNDGRFSFGMVPHLRVELARGNPNIIWGWKRDVGLSSRIVYFGGELGDRNGELILQRWYLFYRHRASMAAITSIAESIHASADLAPHLRFFNMVRSSHGLADLRFELGAPSQEDTDRTIRLQRRRPRRRIEAAMLPTSLTLSEARGLGSFDLYVGSGLSYEAGLPTLCDMHLAFGVDNEACTEFAVGLEDMLPSRLAQDLPRAIAAFCAVHVGALTAAPTDAMRSIATLQADGRVGRVFTDNVDNMLHKVGVDFERVRGSGVFNEVYPATFSQDTLVVIGVAADRRSIVKQARQQGLEIVTVNPCEKVAPMVRHLNYIRPADRFFRTHADTFFRQILSAKPPRRHRLIMEEASPR